MQRLLAWFQRLLVCDEAYPRYNFIFIWAASSSCMDQGMFPPFLFKTISSDFAPSRYFYYAVYAQWVCELAHSLLLKIRTQPFALLKNSHHASISRCTWIRGAVVLMYLDPHIFIFHYG